MSTLVEELTDSSIQAGGNSICSLPSIPFLLALRILQLIMLRWQDTVKTLDLRKHVVNSTSSWLFLSPLCMLPQPPPGVFFCSNFRAQAAIGLSKL